ncbi:short-subunit dehydrogenase [Nakamurella sp. UYEF19]|uniref:SDR family oxidoreductase n=1 Tax=Nakamurella sp. UYEF19 TaxID=1756392 RepID=UPI003391AE7E
MNTTYTARTVLVTGASSGIGRATAEAFVARGYTVVGTSRDPAAIAEENRVDGVEYIPLDLRVPASIEALPSLVGEIDILINNAGESQCGPLEDLPTATVEDLFQLNVFGPLRLTQLVLPGMRVRRYGRVVMIGSMLASFPLAYRSCYVATKAAIKGFSEAARFETSPFGVWLTTVEPGSINTGISERRTTSIADGSPYAADFTTVLSALDRRSHGGIPPRQVAETIVVAVESEHPKPLYAVGSRAPMMFTLRRLTPRTLVEKLVARGHDLSR